jgi:hypothetical protein
MARRETSDSFTECGRVTSDLFDKIKLEKRITLTSIESTSRDIQDVADSYGRRVTARELFAVRLERAFYFLVMGTEHFGRLGSQYGGYLLVFSRGL